MQNLNFVVKKSQGMRKKGESIPVNYFGSEYHVGISIERMSLEDLPHFEDAARPERHDRHSFHLVENGSITLEIDFQKYDIQAPALIYMHPNQVHRIASFKNIQVTSWAINNVSLNVEYLKALESITPVKPLPLEKELFSLLSETVEICLRFSERRTDKLYHSLLKDSCNALVALVISQYLEQSPATDTLSRFETITKAFNETLERNFTTVKRPVDYAKKLNISTAYLNECVKNTTGHSVSHQIRERVILEAKRLLFHSDKSIKEIATELGYDDYPYFSRLFVKATGMTANVFRSKNHD